jgi:hypothetical protein
MQRKREEVLKQLAEQEEKERTRPKTLKTSHQLFLKKLNKDLLKAFNIEKNKDLEEVVVLKSQLIDALSKFGAINIVRYLCTMDVYITFRMLEINRN